MTRETKWLAGLLAAMVVVLSTTCIPEVFTLDECNYLASERALHAGGLSVPGTEGLTPTAELSGFDPSNDVRTKHVTPVALTVPPLYAPFGAPFAALGFRGLILLNSLAFAVTTALVFFLTRRHATQRHTPWVAAATYVLGGFSLAYAQGMWPHMLSVALTTGAAYLVARAREEDRLVFVGAAGALLGIAAGIRYQNIVLAAAVGLTVLLWSKRRLVASAAFAVGVSGPVGVTSLINHARLGTYNPVTKGVGYLASATGPRATLAEAVRDKAMALWSMVVDYSAHPPFRLGVARTTLPKTPETGAFLVVGGLKKALLQSAPWIAVALIALVLVWSKKGAVRVALDGDKARALRALAIPAFAVLALFAWAGLERHDGWSFNQRYLLELVPLFAVTVALVVDSWELDPQMVVVGGALGVALAIVPIVAVVPEHWFRQRALILVPLVLAAGLAAVFLGTVFLGTKRDRLKLALMAASVGWALGVHVGDDMVAERGLREFNGFRREALAGFLPATPAAVLAGAPEKEAVCRLQLDHDLVLADPTAAPPPETGKLTEELLGRGRRVFVFGGVPEAHLKEIFTARKGRMLAVEPFPLAEVVVKPKAARPASSATPD